MINENTKWLKNELKVWKEKQFINDETEKKILDYYSLNNPDVLEVIKLTEETAKIIKTKPEQKLKAPVILSIIAGVLICAGIISLIGYNWHAISRLAKTICAFILCFVPGALLVPSFAGSSQKSFLTKNIVKEFLASIFVILFGACIEFLSQIYLIPVSWENLFLLWFISGLMISFSTRTWGSSGITMVLYLAFCIASKNIFPLLPVSIMFLWWGLSHKNLIFSVISGTAISVIMIVLCFANVWTVSFSLSSTIVYYAATAFAVILPILCGNYKKETLLVTIPLWIFAAFILLTQAGFEITITHTLVRLVLAGLILFCMIVTAILEPSPVCYGFLFFLGFLLLFAYMNFLLTIVTVIGLLAMGLIMFRKHYFGENIINIFLPVFAAFTAIVFLFLFPLGYNHNAYVPQFLNHYGDRFSTAQAIVFFCTLISALVLYVWGFIKNIKQSFVVMLCEISVIFAVLLLFECFGYFNLLNTEIIRTIMYAAFTAICVYSVIRFLVYKSYNLVSFVAAFVIFTIFKFPATFNCFSGAYSTVLMILLLVGFYTLLQTENKSAVIFGKALCCMVMSGMILDVIFESTGRTSGEVNSILVTLLNSDKEKISPYFLISILNFDLLFIFSALFLRPLIKTINKRTFANIFPGFLILILYSFVIYNQFEYVKAVSRFYEKMIPVAALCCIVAFSIYEIIVYFKKNSVFGVNVFACYLLLCAFVKFFLQTKSLIARGVAFIICGIVVLITNIVLSKVAAKQEITKNEA